MTSPEVKPPDAGLFITWQDSRRSASIARRGGMRREVLVGELTGFRRHAWGALQTVRLLLRDRPRLIWYQHSVVLGVVLGAYRRLRTRHCQRLVADIHTKALRRDGGPMARAFVMGIKRWSLGQCTQVVVSNPENRNFAREQLGVDCLVLPDPLPELTAGRSLRAAAAVAHRSCAPVVFIMSFAPDEPIPLASSTAQALRSGHPVVFTGDPSHLSVGARQSLEGAGKLSGYLPEEEYWALLRSSAAIVVLTTEPACLPCGAYEAIALGRRPVLLEDARARDLFRGYAIFSEPDRDVLVSAIELACSEKGRLRGEDIAEYEESWRKSWEEVNFRS